MLPQSQAVDDDGSIARFLAGLLESGRANAADCPLTTEAAEALGLCRDGDWLLPPPLWDPLEPAAIRAALSARALAWLKTLQVLPVIGSTNAELVKRAQGEPIGGTACLAELQLAGRGRRGRAWLSPLGGNLAVSLGFEATRPTAELGGLSLVVGLAVVDALESCGIAGLALKWPNDVLLNGAKLGGILIELVQIEGAVSLVVGVGINVRLPGSARGLLDQAVADLGSMGGNLPPRSQLAGRMISSVVEFEAGFAELGFAPFAPLFDRRHAFQDAEVTVLQGDRAFAGHVLGVALDGGLRVECATGEVVVHGGEVSLRPPAGGSL